MDDRQYKMRIDNGRRKIRAVANSVEADLADPKSKHYDLNPKNRALFLMKVKREMIEDAAKEGVLLNKADLKPFDKKITEYLGKVKKSKENAIKLEEEELSIKAEKAKKAKEKKERKAERKAARKQRKKETDAVTKVATAERGRQARTLKKRMEQSNKLSYLMDKNMVIPDDEDLQYFDESGQLTERQKQLADKMAAQGGKRKTRRKRKTKKRRRKSRRKTRKHKKKRRRKLKKKHYK
tara:strand:+ start:118 stop:831 length:714 start_codon:yes stop_codon:yes gene_type:complete